MDTTLIIAIITMGGLGIFFAAGLAFADKKLRVEENPMIGKVNDLLPGANCGACGKAGCYDFAVNIVAGSASINGCPVGGNDTADEIGELLGLKAEATIKNVARVLCNGGNLEAKKRDVNYIGPQNCTAQTFVSGGDKACNYGCLGGGDCVDACLFNAIFINDNGLPIVIDELCTGCGACVKACPRSIIEMHPINRNMYVFCKNHDDPKASKDVCKVACIGCGICARPSEGAIEVINGLAKVDYAKLKEEIIPVEKCPTKAITFKNKLNEEKVA